MSQPREAAPLRSYWENRSFRAELPSWLVSVALHVSLLALAASSLRSCSGHLPGDSEGNYREVGIYLKQKADLTEKDQEQHPSETESQATFPAVAFKTPEQFPLDEAPPLPLTTPQLETARIGPGALPPAAVESAVSDFIRPSGAMRPSGPAGLGLREGKFFGIRAAGSRFVYVVDSSGSMGGHPIRAAKAELMSSLQGLDRIQQFQIIFYNQTARLMTLRGKKTGELYWANDINRTLTQQFIAGVQPDLGTDHMPALKKALRLNPEVLFFLTDADEPQLTAKELSEISKLNGGRTKIHCIEFGKGPELSLDNFLKKLARQNGGSYRYRDVTRFGRR